MAPIAPIRASDGPWQEAARAQVGRTAAPGRAVQVPARTGTRPAGAPEGTPPGVGEQARAAAQARSGAGEHAGPAEPGDQARAAAQARSGAGEHAGPAEPGDQAGAATAAPGPAEPGDQAGAAVRGRTAGAGDQGPVSGGDQAQAPSTQPGRAAAEPGRVIAGEQSATSPLGLHRVVRPFGVLPQAALTLDPRPEIGPDEVRIRVERLNLDAASFRQLHEAHRGDRAEIRAAVAEIIRTRGKMHNPVTGSGGMLVGVVDEAGPGSSLGLQPGDRVATLVSLSLTPLVITDGLAGWDGMSEQVPCEGHAILFGRSIAAVLPDDLPVPLALAVLDVCGAPALTARVVASYAGTAAGAAARPGGTHTPVPGSAGVTVAIIGASGKSGSLSAAAARRAGADHVIGIVPNEAEAALLRGAGRGTPVATTPAGPMPSMAPPASDARGGRHALADEVVIADARDPVALADAVASAGGPADVTVVCVDVPGCEGGAILATAQGGTVIFFSMATSFTAAALGAEGLAADVTMLIGNGYVPGHAELALDVARTDPAVRALFARRVAQ